MKKLAYFGAAILALAACNKSQTVTAPEQPGEIAFKAIVAPQTKGEEYPVGLAFPQDNTYLIYVGASTQVNPNYFALESPWTGKMFSYCTDKWAASTTAGTATPIYWPLGGVKVDFLAYALKAAEMDADGDNTNGAITPVFDNSTSAAKFTVSDWQVYPADPDNSVDDQIDLMYAVSNGKLNSTSPVTLNFDHTQALVIFNFRLYHGAGGITINSITFDSMVKSGSLEVNNQLNKPEVKWTLAAATDDVVMPKATVSTVSTANTGANAPVADPAAVVNYGVAIEESVTFAQLGEPLIVIPQEAKNITINYTISGNTFDYYLNVPRITWEAGRAYIYDLSFNIYEITLDPHVVDWVDLDV